MKVRVLDPWQIAHGKTNHAPGDEFTANDTDARAWIRAGLAEEVADEPVSRAEAAGVRFVAEEHAKAEEEAVANSESADETVAKAAAQADEDVKATEAKAEAKDKADAEAEAKAQQSANNKARPRSANKSAS